MTGRDKQKIDYYLSRIEKVKTDIINDFIVKKQEKWYETDCGHEIATNFQLKYLYKKVRNLVDELQKGK